MQAHSLQLADDLFQGLAAQVTNLHHVLLRGVDEILNRVDACALEAVEGTNGEVQLLDRHFKHLIVLRFSLFNNGGLGADLLGQVDEQIEVVAEDLCAERYRVAGGDGSVGPDLERQLVIVGQIAATRVFSTV